MEILYNGKNKYISAIFNIGSNPRQGKIVYIEIFNIVFVCVMFSINVLL